MSRETEIVDGYFCTHNGIQEGKVLYVDFAVDVDGQVFWFTAFRRDAEYLVDYFVFGDLIRVEYYISQKREHIYPVQDISKIFA